MKTKNNQKKKIGNRKAGSRQDRRLISHPLEISSYNIVQQKKIRFTLNAAFIGQITFQNLLDTILMATTVTQLADLFYAVRVLKVEAWSIAAIGTPSTLSVVFDSPNTGFVGDQKTYTDTSMGIEPAHVRCKPHPLSLAANFQLSSANTAFFLDLPIGAVLDVVLDYKSSAGGNSVIAQNVGAALTVGALYWRGLDGLALATSKFTPPAGVSQA